MIQMLTFLLALWYCTTSVSATIQYSYDAVSGTTWLACATHQSHKSMHAGIGVANHAAESYSHIGCAVIVAVVS